MPKDEGRKSSRPETTTKRVTEAEKRGGQETRPNAPEPTKVDAPTPPPIKKK